MDEKQDGNGGVGSEDSLDQATGTTEVVGQEAQSELDIDHELKFTGFEQPKESGFWVSVKHHKVRFVVGTLLTLTVLVGGTLLAVSRGDDSEVIVQDQPQKSEGGDRVVAEQPAADFEVAAPDITKAEYSLNTNGTIFELVSGTGDSWLSRSEFSWAHTTRWEDWLFFTSNRSAQPTIMPGEPGYTVGIEAFNFKTNEYLSLAQLVPPGSSSFQTPLYVDGDYLYIRFSALKSEGATHRCTLSEQKGCSDMELFYGGAGEIKQINNETAIVIDGFGDGGFSTSTVKRLNIITDEVIDLTTLTNNLGIGSTLAAIAVDELLWIVETTGDQTQAQQDPDYDGVVTSRMYAIDMQGETKFVLPAQGFPIAKAELLRSDELGSSEVVFANDEQEVAFDTATKQFGAVKDRSQQTQDDEGPKSDIRKIVELSTQIGLPDDFVLRVVN